MKTKYLIPQIGVVQLHSLEHLMQSLGGFSPPGDPSGAPERGYNPGGGDLGGVPTN